MIPIPILFPVPNISNTKSGTFFGPIFCDTGSDTPRKNEKFPVRVPIINLQNSLIFRNWFQDFFPVPNVYETGSETFSGTNLFRYWFRYHHKKWKISVTGTSHSDPQCCIEERGEGSKAVFSKWKNSSTWKTEASLSKSKIGWTKLIQKAERVQKAE